MLSIQNLWKYKRFMKELFILFSLHRIWRLWEVLSLILVLLNEFKECQQRIPKVGVPSVMWTTFVCAHFTHGQSSLSEHVRGVVLILAQFLSHWSFLELQHSLNCICATVYNGFGWDRAEFLHSSLHGTVLWICARSSAGNTGMFQLLMSSSSTALRTFLLLTPLHQREGWVCTRNGKGSLTPADHRGSVPQDTVLSS